MAPVVWGLDLAELKWSKFGNKNMWSKDWYLRRQKNIIYQCCLIFSVISESLGTDVLTAYVDAQKKVAQLDPSVYVYNNNYVGAASYNIWCGIFVAFIFGSVFFFDLVWPERKESHGVRLAWKICGVLSCIFLCADAFLLTIITATKCVHFIGATDAYGQSLQSQSHKDGGAPRCYRDQGRAIASVVFVWPGFLFTVWSCILLWLSIDRTEFGPGPLSDYGLKNRGMQSSRMGTDPQTQVNGVNEDPEKEVGFQEANHTPSVSANAASSPAHPTAEIPAPQPVHAGETVTR